VSDDSGNFAVLKIVHLANDIIRVESAIEERLSAPTSGSKCMGVLTETSSLGWARYWGLWIDETQKPNCATKIDEWLLYNGTFSLVSSWCVTAREPLVFADFGLMEDSTLMFSLPLSYGPKHMMIKG